MKVNSSTIFLTENPDGCTFVVMAHTTDAPGRYGHYDSHRTHMTHTMTHTMPCNGNGYALGDA